MTTNFIEKFVFSPDNLSVTEFMGNYFIGLLGYVFPVFLLLGLGVSVYGWVGKGARKEEIKTIAVQILASVLVMSFLLFNPGRKTMETSYGTSHSYWIIDTLNDLLAIGSRFSDAFVYNLLFGNNYNSSDRKLFEFDSEHMFKLVNYGTTPNGDDFVDGYFISGMSGLIKKQAADNTAATDATNQKMQDYFNEDLQKDKDSIDRIKNFVNDPDYYKSSLLFFKSLQKLKENEGKVILDITSEDKTGKTIETNINKFKEFMTSDNTEVSAPSIKNNSLFNFRYNDSFGIPGESLKINKTLIMNMPSYNDKGALTNGSGIISMGKKEKEIPISINSDNTINSTNISDIITQANNSNNFYSGYDTTVSLIANSLENKDAKNNILAIKDKYKNRVDTNTVLNEIYTKYGDDKNYPFVTAVKSGSAKPEELQTFLNFYYSVLENKYEKYVWEVKNEIAILKGMKQDISANNIDLLLNYVTDNLQIDKNSQVDIKGVSNHALQTMDTSENAKEQFAKVMGNVATNSYNNSIGKTSNANKGGSGVQLKYLEQSYIFLKDIEDTFSFFGIDFVTFNEVKDGAQITSFHWYDLGNYTMGLKTLYGVNNELNNIVSGLQGQASANNFMAQCNPVYKNISYNKQNGKTPVVYEDDRYKICFPQPKNTVKNSMASLAKTVSTIVGIYAGGKAAMFLPGTAWKGWGTIIILLGATAIASLVGFIVFAVVYTALLLIYFFIPVVFFYTSVMSWIFRASISMVFFGFSIIIFVFDQKKQQLEQATINFIMYTLMPVYITFIFFLTINVSFIIGATIDEIFPSFEDKSLAATDLRALEKVSSDQIMRDEKLRDKVENASVMESFLAYLNQKGYSFGDKLVSADEAVQNFNTIGFKKIAIFLLLDFGISILKFMMLVSLEIMLYTNLWKVDRFINEMIGSNVSNDSFAPEKVIGQFGLNKFT